ncbi:MAG TPA: hypothetical protein VFW40_06225, partial [Capsulimonadaceae bacterium]|nr:hypothetical protein [Capsulimonadaceae bacterium]
GHVNLNGTNPFPAGNGILSVDIVEGGSAYTGATQAVFGQSFASLEFVSVPLRGFIQGGTLQFESPANAIALRLLPAGNDSTGNPWTYQNVPLTIDTAGGFASGDLTALLPSAVACVSKAQILFLDNPVVSAAAFNCNVGALTIAGNLSVGFASYTYAYTEVNSNGDTQLVEIIESDPSPFSNTVSPTGEFATAQVALPDHSILNNGVSDMWYLYRAGGTFSDGLFRLVDAGHWTEAWTFGQSRSGDTPPGMQLTPQNGFTTWGQNDQKNNAAPAGSKYFVDNTPDANLVNNPTLVVGKQAAPPGAQAIASFQNRLWLAVGGTVISSWLLDASSDAGLYFNPTLDPSDPNAPIKGSGTIPVGMDDGDPVVGLKTLGTVLTVWKGLSSYFIDGYDPTNFGCNEYTAIEGQGLVAPKGIVVADNVIYLLQQDGVYTFDGSQLAKISDAIGPYIRPVLNEDGGHISASAYANTSCVFHGGRLYLFAPVTGGTQNSVAHLWDGRFQAWVGRWTGTNITSAVSIGSNTDDPDLWAGGYDGQLYRFIGNGDTPAAGGLAAVAVTNAGSGYGSAPTISFSGGGGSGAAGTATVSGGKVTGVTITNPGGGYTSAPTVSFSGGGGSGAAAAAGLFAPVPFTLATRAYGRPPEGLSIWLQGRYNLPLGIEEGGWEPFFRKVRVTRLWLEAVNGGLGALGLTAGVQYTDQVSAVTYPVSVTGHQRVSVRAKPGRGGLGVIVTLAGATASGLSIVAAGATISRGARME